MSKPLTYIDGAGRHRCATCGDVVQAATCICHAPEWTHATVKEELNKLSLLHWGVEYNGNVEIVKTNWQLKKAAFTWSETGGYAAILLSRPVLAATPRKEMRGYLLHELVHWWQHKNGLPFHDTDPEFIRECVRVGAPISDEQSAKEAARRVLA